jgi:CheY-like chemotaxis protein
MSTPATPFRVENCPNSAGCDHEEFCEVHDSEHVANLRAAVTHRPGSGPKILVVDDDKDNRSIFVRLLRKIGQFDIRDTGSSLAAIQAVRDECPDIITTDVKRPSMDGLDTVERIRKIEGAEKVWIIVISATLAMAGCKEHALAVGCDECLEKPLDRESFRAAITRGLVHRGCWTVGMGLAHIRQGRRT